MSYSIFDGEILFDYTEINLPDEHFLRKFLVEFKLEKFEIIRTRSTNLNLKEVEPEQKVVIHDLIKDEFYKIYYGMYRDRLNLNDKFYNNAYFPTNLITTYLNDDWWIMKSTRVPGEDVYNFLLDKSKMTFTMDEFLDAMLQTLKLFNDEGRRLFPDMKVYLSIGEVDWISANNMFYDSITKQFTKVDHEPNILWVNKQTYMNNAIRSFIALFASLMAFQASQHIMDYVADGKNILKRIEYCIDFVETEIFD
jgi:hypothetical protein|tara:strand:- start:332 stop:1087 length:756 start_codon:yes stop_codon:yes gene_type:complete